jgi:Protein of unknown function (DUF541)
MSSQPRFLLLGTTVTTLVLGLVIGAGAVFASGASTPSKAPSPAPSAVAGVPSVLVPSTPDTTSVGGTATGTGTAVGNSGTAVSGAAIAYPYFGGTPGIAPDHTIVVTGVGQADMKSDGSNRAAAQKTALAAALADAKTQADAIASETRLSISGVLSVSASVSPYGVAMPMVATPDSAPNAPVPAPGKTVLSPEVLGVSVTVAYRVG